MRVLKPIGFAVRANDWVNRVQPELVAPECRDKHMVLNSAVSRNWGQVRRNLPLDCCGQYLKRLIQWETAAPQDRVHPVGGFRPECCGTKPGVSEDSNAVSCVQKHDLAAVILRRVALARKAAISQQPNRLRPRYGDN
jgi:hypothetical protein